MTAVKDVDKLQAEQTRLELELTAIREVSAALERLSVTERANVLQYINARHLRDVLPPRPPWDDDQVGHVMVGPPMRGR